MSIENDAIESVEKLFLQIQIPKARISIGK